MHLAVAPLKDPLQHAAVFTITRPQVLTMFVLARPVDVENLRQLGRVGTRANFKPVREVIAHVVSAKWKHRHGVAAQLAHFPGDRGGRLAAGGCAQKSSVLPVERFRNQWNNSGAAPTEQNRIDRNAFGIFPLGSDDRTLFRGGCKSRVRVRRLPARVWRPWAPQPIYQLGRLLIAVYPLPPYVAVECHGAIGEDRI